MANWLLLARVGTGKTDEAQRRLDELKQREPLAKSWVLLSTDRQIVDFRRRFMPNGRVFFNVEYFNFYSLYRRLLAITGKPQRCLDDTARYGLIRAMLAEFYRERVGIFKGIAQTPGFVAIIAAFIYELKQNLIEPEDFLKRAQTPKEAELAAIYLRYQNLLRDHDLVDREGEGWLALAELECAPDLVRDVDLLIVDGYDQFNRLQSSLLAVLGQQVREGLITLTTVPERETTVGQRFQEAQDQLVAEFAAHGVPLELDPYSAPEDDRHPTLNHLMDHFLRVPPAIGVAAGAVTLLEAPDPAREIGMVLRRVKRLLLDGCPPDDILIALRDWPLYGGQVAAQGAVYDLPLALHYGVPLAQNPAVVALLDLLSLHVGDFRRRDLLDTLRSPYFEIPGIDADLLEWISIQQRITGGRSAWLAGIEAARVAQSVHEDDPPSEAIDPDRLSWLWINLKTCFDAITPPERGTIEVYVSWLEGLIGQDDPDPDAEAEPAEAAAYSLKLPQRIRADTDAAIVARDLAAMQTLKLALRGLLSAQELAGTLGYTAEADWKTFFRDLKTTVDHATVGRGSGRDGRVLVTTIADARGLPHRHIFIPGLSEGIFPQPTPEDPLLLDTERQRLRANGIHLPTQAERAADDGLFYSVIGQARELLVLSRPHSKNGEIWAASHLWRAVEAIFTDVGVEHFRLGDVPSDPATLPEAALAVADDLSKGRVNRALLDRLDADAWARIERGRAVEISRMSRRPHNHFSGRLSDADLIAQVAEQIFAPGKEWSASQLNDYGLCGFRYFAARVLNLAVLEEPEDAMDSRQLGTLYHAILEQTYRELGGVVTPDRVDEALAVLDRVAGEQMAVAPEQLGFRPSVQWDQEQAVLRRRLEKLIRDDFSPKSTIDKQFPGERQLYQQEMRFGRQSGRPVAIDLGGETIFVRGSIDRMDRQGDRVIVVDYKTGSTPIKSTEISDGRNFQMMIYLLAAQALLENEPNPPREVAGGLFWRIGGESLGTLKSEDQETIDAGKDHIRRYLERARAGDFAAHATKLDGGRCAHYCDFHQFCRVSITERRKP